MPEPLTSSGEPLRSWFARFSGSGWGGRAFWSILIGVTVFLLISGYGAFVGANKENLHFAFLGGMSGFAATAMGAVVAVALRNIAARTQDIMLGFAAGMMLAASSFSLILPGIEAAQAPLDLARYAVVCDHQTTLFMSLKQIGYCIICSLKADCLPSNLRYDFFHQRSQGRIVFDDNHRSFNRQETFPLDDQSKIP